MYIIKALLVMRFDLEGRIRLSWIFFILISLGLRLVKSESANIPPSRIRISGSKCISNNPIVWHSYTLETLLVLLEIDQSNNTTYLVLNAENCSSFCNMFNITRHQYFLHTGYAFPVMWPVLDNSIFHPPCKMTHVQKRASFKYFNW